MVSPHRIHAVPARLVLNVNLKIPVPSFMSTPEVKNFHASPTIPWERTLPCFEIQKRINLSRCRLVQINPYNYIFFGGRGWVLGISPGMEEDDQDVVGNLTALQSMLLSSSNTEESPFDFLYQSEPVDYGSPSFRATPEGLRWFQVGGVASKWQPENFSSTTLVCAFCNNNSDAGTCNAETDRCECDWSYSSVLCEKQANIATTARSLVTEGAIVIRSVAVAGVSLPISVGFVNWST